MPPIGTVDAIVEPPYTQAWIDAAMPNAAGKNLYKLANSGSIMVGTMYIVGPQYDTKGNLMRASQTFYAPASFLTQYPAGFIVPGP